MAMDGLYPRNAGAISRVWRDVMYPPVIRASCPHPLGQLKLFKFVSDKFVQEKDAEGMAMYGTIKSCSNRLASASLTFPLSEK